MKAALMGLLFVATGAFAANETPEALQESFMAAMRANDAAGIAACYTRDAVSFPVDSMMDVGPDAVRASWEGFFSAYQVQEASLSETHLEMHGNTAIAWGLFSLTAIPTGGGEPVEMNGRFMDVSRNIGGHWFYVADHASMPIPSEAPSTEAEPDPEH